MRLQYIENGLLHTLDDREDLMIWNQLIGGVSLKLTLLGARYPDDPQRVRREAEQWLKEQPERNPDLRELMRRYSEEDVFFELYPSPDVLLIIQCKPLDQTRIFSFVSSINNRHETGK